MTIHGCHSCGVDLSKYTNYLESPCASCKLCKEYSSTHRAALFDSGEEDYDESLVSDENNLNDTYIEAEKDLVYSCIEKDVDRQIEIIKEVIEKQIFTTASGLILDFIKLSKENPTMFEVVIKKMQYPFMSYSEIGNSMNPPCSKQNILYHLRHAVRKFPELANALLTDTRFSGGTYALQTIANTKRKLHAKKRIQGLLYGSDELIREKSMREINSILSSPFMVSDEVLNFNPYIKDEVEDEFSESN